MSLLASFASSLHASAMSLLSWLPSLPSPNDFSTLFWEIKLPVFYVYEIVIILILLWHARYLLVMVAVPQLTYTPTLFNSKVCHIYTLKSVFAFRVSPAQPELHSVSFLCFVVHFGPAPFVCGPRLFAFR